MNKKLPKFKIVTRKEKSWFEEAIERIEKGKLPFKKK